MRVEGDYADGCSFLLVRGIGIVLALVIVISLMR
jgi:hypothetical protein